MIVYFGNTQDMFLKNTLILRPHKLIQLIKRLVYNHHSENEYDDGIIDERTFENLCQPYIEQKQSLLALLKKFDLLCERILPSSTTTTTNILCKQYYVPSCIKKVINEKIGTEKDEQSVVFYYLFDGYFPGKDEYICDRKFIVKFYVFRKSFSSNSCTNNQMDTSESCFITETFLSSRKISC